MSRFDKDSPYLAVRRWVDHDIASHSRAPTVSVSTVITIGLTFAVVFAESWLSRMVLFLPLLASAACTVFVLWRMVRMTRAATIKGDRGYDQKTKFTLPPEYADSESVLAASRRGRRARRH